MKVQLNKEDQLLKRFLEEHIPFHELRKVGFFHKDMKKSDIHGQAKRICEFFGYKTVYEYGAKVTYAHISYASGIYGLDSDRPLHIDEEGKLKEAPFIEQFGGIYE
ncbi:hypothetical protein FKG96_09990 [Olivibacter sp. LS-1]|uniref:hypothetical protein n=1 Tax=Olivibacter sp. LS-1 TaxID=2592345 RepID=UPI0011EB1614|nr:hypothetical protein [Olivibacter sp. LS-1]QEL01124.1 hypothetical protein FKG96_09990 [Olivibacter sp. LS-1]